VGGEEVPELDGDLEDLVVLEPGELENVLEALPDAVRELEVLVLQTVEQRLEPGEVRAEEGGEEEAGGAADVVELRQLPLVALVELLLLDLEVEVGLDDEAELLDQVLVDAEQLLLDGERVAGDVLDPDGDDLD